MSNVGNKYKVGFLVLTGLAILIIGLLALGAFKGLRKTYAFCTVVSSSVQGLDKGAKVKFKGVAIGEVTKIKIMGGSGRNFILICMKFDPEAFSQSFDKKLDYKQSDFSALFTSTIEGNVERGLRCKLQYASISGDLYIEIDYADPMANPPMDVVMPEEAPPVYIPSAESSSIAAVIAESQKTIANIGRIDFARLANKTERFLDTANDLFTDKRIAKTLEQSVEITNNIKELTGTLNSEINSESVRKLTKDVQSVFDNLNATLVELKSTMKDAKVQETVEKARTLMDSSDRFVKKAETLREELSQSISKLDSALDAARLLLDLLERNPDAILRGKSSKPVVDK